MDDKFKGRKIKCPKCGARVVHVRDAEVKLLTAGTVPAATSAPAAPAAPPAPVRPPLEDATPVATAVMPHSVTEFVRQNESRQNTLIIGALIGVFAAALSVLGIVMDLPLLAVAPIGVALTIAAVWLWMRKRKLEQKVRASEKTEPIPKK